MSKFKLNEMFNFDLNYTYTSTYDGAEQDNPILVMIRLSNGKSSKEFS